MKGIIHGKITSLYLLEPCSLVLDFSESFKLALGHLVTQLLSWTFGEAIFICKHNLILGEAQVQE